MQVSVHCENTFKSSNTQMRMETFTEKWVKCINQWIKQGKVIPSK